MDTAVDHIDSQAWVAKKDDNGNYIGPANKCNIFVYDILNSSGASPGLPNGFIHGNPPTAAQWANADYVIPHWRVLGSDETPLPGDVVAQRGLYSDATGHVMVVGPDSTVIGTGDHAHGPYGTIERIPMPENLVDLRAIGGPKLFRRWTQE